jgi:glycosyltransferase involved in cell wall biosynthesis
MSKSKVCILTSAHPAFNVRIFEKQAKTLVGAGYDVTVIVPHEKDEFVDGVQVKAVAKPLGRVVRMTQTPWQIYQEAIRLKADIYHFHDPELIPVGLLLKLRGKRVIYDVHEYNKRKILSKHYIPAVMRKPIAIAFDCFESLASRFYDGVVVTDKITEKKFNGNAIRVENFPYPAAKRPEVKKTSGCFNLVYLGVLTENRGLFKMVSAMEFMQESTKLLLVGPYGSIDRKKAQGIKGYEKVEWFGYKPWPEALKIAARSDVGLALFQPVPAYLYAGENTVKLFEYMLFGLPIIASNFPSLKEIIEKEKCGVVVDPVDPKAIAEAIIRLMKAPDLMREMGQNGIKAVAEKYNWVRASENLLELYANVLAN